MTEENEISTGFLNGSDKIKNVKIFLNFLCNDSKRKTKTVLYLIESKL